MRSLLSVAVTLPLLVACSTSQQASAVKVASTTVGQLFCQVEGATGATVVGIIDAAASGVAPIAAPVAVLATGLAKSQVDAICAQAAVNAGAGAGVPVSPPTTPVGNVAVMLPAPRIGA